MGGNATKRLPYVWTEEMVKDFEGEIDLELI